jgi:hypothetical protein
LNHLYRLVNPLACQSKGLRRLVVYSAGLICTGITRGLTSVVRVKASAIAATSAPSSGSC